MINNSQVHEKNQFAPELRKPKTTKPVHKLIFKIDFPLHLQGSNNL